MSNLKHRLMNPKTGVVVFVAILVLVAVSVAYTQETLKPVDSVIVVDANSKKVGEVIGIWVRGNPMVAFDLNKSVFLIGVRPNRLTGTSPFGEDGLYFDSLNCTGKAYLTAYGAEEFLIPTVVVNKPGHTLYIPEPGSTPQMITPQSMLGYDFSTYNTCTNITGPQTGYFPALPVVDLDSLFTAPFKLQAGPKNNGNGKGKDK